MLLVATATHFTSFRCEWYSPSASITHWRLKDGLSKRSPCLLIALGRIWVQIQRHLNLGKLPSDRKSAEWYCLQDPTGGCGKCGLWRGKNRNTSTVQSQGRRRKGEEKIGPKWARPLQLEEMQKISKREYQRNHPSKLPTLETKNSMAGQWSTDINNAHNVKKARCRTWSTKKMHRKERKRSQSGCEQNAPQKK